MFHLGPGFRLPVTLQRRIQSGDEDMHRFALAENLRQALKAQGTCRLLFGPDTKLGSDPHSLSAHRLKYLLPPIMVMAAWRHNVEYFEKRLNAFRHDAIARPSLETFDPLTLLRRNIAHLEEAVSAARGDIDSWTKQEYERRRKIVKSELKSLDDQYDALLQRIKTMSTTLNNEIQLVIGSVTVQVCLRLSSDAIYP